MPTDEELAIAAKALNDDAFAELVRRYLRRVHGFSYRYLLDRAEAEEATQETFVKAWRALHRFDQKRSFATWLFAIARNTALDRLKKKHPIPFAALQSADGEGDMAETLADPEPLPPEALDAANLASRLEAALAGLHPDDRAIIALHYDEHQTFEEIAETLGKPMNTVKSRHRRALGFLRDNLTLHQNGG